jgi:hypothetical protein
MTDAADARKDWQAVSRALCAPFPPCLHKVRPGRAGRSYVFIDARSAQNRLDEVLGPFGWQTSYRRERIQVERPDGQIVEMDGMICRLEVWWDGRWVGKEAGATFRDMEEKDRQGRDQLDEDNLYKTAFTVSFKLAAAAWGVARYLYRAGVPAYAWDDVPGEFLPDEDRVPAGTRDRERDRDRDQAPRREGGQWGGRNNQGQGRGQDRRASGNANGSGQGQGQGRGQHDGPPRSGRAFFAWLKEQDQRHEGLIRTMIGWGKQQGYPSRFVDWNEDQVGEAVAEVNVRITGGQDADAYEDTLSN